MDQLVRWSRRVRSADEVPAAVTEAFGSFTGRRTRPVHIEIPIDVLEQAWTGEPRIGTPVLAPAPDHDAVRRVAELLAVIRCDIDPALDNCPADHALLGDAATTLDALLAALPTKSAGGEELAATLRSACREEAAVDAGMYAEINAAVRAALPDEAVLTGDNSQVTYFGSVHFFDVPAPRRFCYSPGFATLGYGLPAGLGQRSGGPVHRWLFRSETGR